MKNIMKNIKKKKRWKAFLLTLFLVCAAAGGAARSEPESAGSQEAQEALAADYLFAISRTPAGDAEAREKLYLDLIENCPETQSAEAAHWALSNIYLDDFDEPREKEAREILQKFLERYPSSQWRRHVENRLASLWGE